VIVLDAVCNQLFPGDKVAFSDVGYREIKVGIIMYLTPHGARIMALDYYNREYNRNRIQIVKMEDADV